MLRNFHPPFLGLCESDSCKREHVEIDVAGKEALIVLDCEHRQHAYYIHPLTAMATIQRDLETILPCAHDPYNCTPNGCDHHSDACVIAAREAPNCDLSNHVKGCGLKLKLTVTRGEAPALITETFG